LGLSRSSDNDILEFAKREGYTVVTLDADFHSLLAYSAASVPSVIRIRTEGLKSVGLTNLLRQIAADYGPTHDRGAVLTVGPKRTAIHHLPITRPNRE